MTVSDLGLCTLATPRNTSHVLSALQAQVIQLHLKALPWDRTVVVAAHLLFCIPSLSNRILEQDLMGSLDLQCEQPGSLFNISMAAILACSTN